MGDTFISRDTNRDFLDYYSLKGSPTYSLKGSPTMLPEKDTYRGPTYETISTFKADQGQVNPVNKVDVLYSSTGGVFAGTDKNGNVVMNLSPPDEYVPPLMPEAQRRDAVQRSNQQQEQRRFEIQGRFAATVGALLAVCGRFLTIPVSQMERLFHWLGYRFQQHLGGPLERAANLTLRIAKKGYNFAEPYLAKAKNWAATQGKRFLDALIIETPKALWSAIKKTPRGLARLLDRLATWLES